MKILFLGEPESPNTVSWVEGLRRQGCEVHIASARTDGRDGCIPIGSAKLPPRIRILTGTRHLRRIIRDLKPDILLAYRVTSYGFLAARAGFHPLVLAAQNENIVFQTGASLFRRKILAFCARYAIARADLMHAWGENIAKGLIRHGADEHKILTMHRGIDLDKFQARRGKKFNRESPVFVSTRSLYPEYNINKVIEAFALVVRVIPGAKLKILGKGAEAPVLKKITSSLSLDEKVAFLGRLDHDKLAEELQASDFYISIIDTEGLSSSLIESIACGVLPIVYDMPSSIDLVRDKIDGLLVNDTSASGLASAMIEAVEIYDKLEPALATNSKSVRQRFDREANQKVFVQKYMSLSD